jgi:hypothetical protein
MGAESFYYFQIAEGVVDKEPQEAPEGVPQIEHWNKDFLYIKAPDLATAQIKAENMAFFLNYPVKEGAE